MADDNSLGAHRAGALKSYRAARALGLDCWIELLGPAEPWPCSAAAAAAPDRFGDNDLPILPLAGCDRARHGCACCFVVKQPLGQADTLREAAYKKVRALGIDPEKHL